MRRAEWATTLNRIVVAAICLGLLALIYFVAKWT